MGGIELQLKIILLNLLFFIFLKIRPFTLISLFFLLKIKNKDFYYFFI